MLALDLEDAGIRRATSQGVLHFHSLRHTYVTNLASSTVPTVVVQRLARLSTPLLFNRYAHPSDTAAEQALASLPRADLRVFLRRLILRCHLRTDAVVPLRRRGPVPSYFLLIERTLWMAGSLNICIALLHNDV